MALCLPPVHYFIIYSVSPSPSILLKVGEGGRLDTVTFQDIKWESGCKPFVLCLLLHLSGTLALSGLMVRESSPNPVYLSSPSSSIHPTLPILSLSSFPYNPLRPIGLDFELYASSILVAFKLLRIHGKKYSSYHNPQ